MERIRKEVAAYAKVPGVARGPHEMRLENQTGVVFRYNFVGSVVGFDEHSFNNWNSGGFCFFCHYCLKTCFLKWKIPISCFKSTPPIGLGPMSLVVRRRALILSARMVEVNLWRRKMAKDP